MDNPLSTWPLKPSAISMKMLYLEREFG